MIFPLRKEAMDSLQRLRSAVEQTADTVIISDREGTIEYVNDAFVATTGYRREEALGRTPRILSSGVHDKAFYERLWKTIQGGEPFRGIVVNRKKSGEFYHAEQTISPILDAAGNITHFVSVAKDITDRLLLAEQQLELRVARSVQHALYPAIAPSDERSRHRRRGLSRGGDCAGTTLTTFPCAEVVWA